jgi:hypothetical protein
MDDAKLVQRERLVPAFLLLPGQVERLARVLPGLLAASRQTTDLAEPHNPVGSMTRARADTFADRLLQQRVPLREAPPERRGIAQARQDHAQKAAPVARRATEGQALVEHPDGVLQVSLGEGQLTEAGVDNDRCGPLGLPA